jgi:hypothetical protein
MRAFLLMAVLLALVAPSRGQTCGGALTLPLGRVYTHTYTGAAVDTLVAWAPRGVRALAIGHGSSRQQGVPTVTGRPSPDSLRAALPTLEGFEASFPQRFEGLFMPPDEIRTWTRCGYALLRYTVANPDGRREADWMVIDLYNVPAHVPVALGGRLPLAPGRWTFDFADGAPFAPESFRREPSDER